MTDQEKVFKGLECCASMNGSACGECPYSYECVAGETEYQTGTAHLAADALKLLKELPEVIRCNDCKHWDKTTREEGNDCISGPWEDAECDMFRDWDRYGDLGEDFRRTNGSWYCADGERRDEDD